MKQKYPYSTRFRKPLGVGNFNFEQSALRPLIGAYANAIQKKTARFQPPKGIRKSRILISSGDTVLPCYVLEPEDAAGELPGILYLHGGGFLFPILHSRLNNAMYYAWRMQARVLMPEYRLAWKNPFPAAFDDCFASYEYLLSHARQMQIDPDRLLLMGDSAGGCLAAGLTLKARDEGNLHLKGQVLIYPATDDNMDYPSMAEYKDAVWTAASNRHMWNIYTAKGFFGMQEYAIPMTAKNLSGLPPAYVEPQEMDCLRDQGVAYARRLEQAGVPVCLRVIQGSYHGFDVDMKNQTVQTILDQRCSVMESMLTSPVGENPFR